MATGPNPTVWLPAWRRHSKARAAFPSRQRAIGCEVAGHGYSPRGRLPWRRCSHRRIWSRPLAAQLGDRAPLETQRGYHIMIRDPESHRASLWPTPKASWLPLPWSSACACRLGRAAGGTRNGQRARAAYTRALCPGYAEDRLCMWRATIHACRMRRPFRRVVLCLRARPYRHGLRGQMRQDRCGNRFRRDASTWPPSVPPLCPT
jgi:hypothetical protein